MCINLGVVFTRTVARKRWVYVDERDYEINEMNRLSLGKVWNDPRDFIVYEYLKCMRV